LKFAKAFKKLINFQKIRSFPKFQNISKNVKSRKKLSKNQFIFKKTQKITRKLKAFKKKASKILKHQKSFQKY